MNAPDRIYNWLNTQLSLARLAGGCKYNGHEYVIAYDEPGQPLVRADVIKSEAKAKREAAKEQRKRAQDAQKELI